MITINLIRVLTPQERVVSHKANTIKNNATVEELRAVLRDLEALTEVNAC